MSYGAARAIDEYEAWLAIRSGNLPWQRQVLAAVTRGMISPIEWQTSQGRAAEPATILDRIDDTLTFYSAGLGGEITVPVESPQVSPPPAASHPNRCDDQYLVLLHGARTVTHRRYCYADLLEHHPDDELRVRSWLDEHGIDHTTVPIDTTIVVDGPRRVVRVRVYRRNESGCFYLDDGGGIVHVMLTVRLRSPWPLADMLRGESPRTRRWRWRRDARLRGLLERHSYSPAALNRLRRVRHHQSDTMTRIHTDYHRRHR